MKDWKPLIGVPVTFERRDHLGSREIRLTLLPDNSVYLDGDEELVFDQGRDPLKAAMDYLQEKGYKKRA